MIEKSVKVRNLAGIHCRPSSVILMAAQEYPECRLHVASAKGESELDSILSLLGMGLERGDEVVLRAEGKDEAVACERMAELFAREFDFPQPEDQNNEARAMSCEQDR
jgi:phosphocarrier protein